MVTYHQQSALESQSKGSEGAGIKAGDQGLTAAREGNGVTAIGTHAKDARIDFAVANDTLAKVGLGDFHLVNSSGAKGDHSGDPVLPLDTGRDDKGGVDKAHQGFTKPALFPEWHAAPDAKAGETKLPGGSTMHREGNLDVVTRPDGERIELRQSGPVVFDSKAHYMQPQLENSKFAASPEVLADGTRITGYEFQNWSGSGSLKFKDGEEIKITNNHVDVDKTGEGDWDKKVKAAAETMSSDALGKRWDDAFKNNDSQALGKVASDAGKALSLELSSFPASLKSTPDMIKEFGDDINKKIQTQGAGMVFIPDNNNHIRIMQAQDITDPKQLGGLAAEMGTFGEAKLNQRGIYRYEGGFVQRIAKTTDEVIDVPKRADESKIFTPGMRSL
jgi:hypothetical protein